MSEDKPQATFVTFYSFKGGVGRSMALINTAGILAGQHGFRVLVIDVDLEAPGLSYLDPGAPDETPAQSQRQLQFEAGFVDLLSDAKERGDAADLFVLSPEGLAEKYTKTIAIPPESREFTDGSLRVMPAGKFDGSYAKRLNSLNIGQLYRDGIGEPLVRTFKKKLAESGLYDYVLIDSRTGLSDEAGMCTRDLADHLMILSGLNRQNVEGTSEFLRALRAVTEGKKTLQIILSPVPTGEDKLADEREKAASEAFGRAWNAKIDVSLHIPYHPQLALTEEPHIFRRRKGYLFESYRAIERSMLRMLDHTAQAFFRRAFALLRKKEYATALRELKHMVRLEGGRSMLLRLAEEISYPERFGGPQVDDQPLQPPTVKTLLTEKDGAALLEFVVEWLPVSEHEWAGRGLVGRLWEFSPELASKLFLRLLSGSPNDAGLLTYYASFLNRDGGDFDAAETYFQKALEADSNDASNISQYADFLVQRRGNLNAAEDCYQRAIKVDPADAGVFASYARFLAERRGNLIEAERYYEQAVRIAPQVTSYLGDYGQILAARGRLKEATAKLLSAFDLRPKDKGDVAELCFSLWLAARMQGQDGKRWEAEFKRLIESGFKRHSWSFDAMLEKAKGVLLPEEFSYAQAMAAAFLDAKKVASLASFPRWMALEATSSNRQKVRRPRRRVAE
jgi:tetratricopeptide (TPR) repeat protein